MQLAGLQRFGLVRRGVNLPASNQIRQSASGAVFRPEIEGLRAVAAALVAIFHIWLGRVSGGVDVFFVVSGFLITTGLLSRIERTGSPQLARFWGRLVIRLVPAALTVLLAIVITSRERDDLSTRQSYNGDIFSLLGANA